MGTPPDALLRLIDRFDQNRKVFLSGDYKEEQLRLEFLNPFFTALGWDMDNICEPDNSEFRTQRLECRTSGHSDFWFLISDFCIIRFVNRQGLSEFSVIANSVHSSWSIVPGTEERKPGTKNREPGTDEVIRLTAGHQAKSKKDQRASLPPARLTGRAPRRLSAMQTEPRPALTRKESSEMSPNLPQRKET